MARKPLNKFPVQDLRLERKYIFTGKDLSDIESQVLQNSSHFKEIFQQRTINNIYFDDINHSLYHENISGISTRNKWRLRWYGDNFNLITKPVLEIKRKFGELGDKISTPIDLSSNLKEDRIGSVKKQIKTLLDKDDKKKAIILNNLFPSLLNSYKRKYYLSACGKIRITLDFELKFWNPKVRSYQKTTFELDKREVILELKYGKESQKEAMQIANQFKARLSKNSKYVRGVDMVNYNNPV